MQEGKLRENSVNVNACIEAGICWGASVPLIPLAAYSSDQLSKMKHVPFMFRNSQVHQYCDDTRSLESGVEFLGVVHREVARHQRKNGRRVINYELTEPGS